MRRLTRHAAPPAAWRQQRRGMALVAALVLLALSAALATATFSASRAMRRAALLTRTRARVEAAVPRAFADVLAGWSAVMDTLPVGDASEVKLASDSAADGPPLGRTAWVNRTTDRLYAITVDIRAFGDDHPLARRHARLWLERPAGAEPSAGAGGMSYPPPFVTPWAFSDLY
ncbi:MAG TPA: hypothetical protein VF034_16265 [Gemmatimonadaceae bacterium]